MRLLILGTGGMANQHAKHFAAMKGVTLVGGVDVDPARVEAFNKAHNIERGFGSLDAALAWGEFDAVANVTPDSIHHPTTLAALRADKHVFCEKPLATDHAKALEMTEDGRKTWPHQHGQSHLSQRRAAAKGPRDRAVGAAGQGQAFRGELSAELAGLQGLGRLAHRKPVAVAPAARSTAPMACWAISACTSSISPPMAPAAIFRGCSAASKPSKRPPTTRSGNITSMPMTALP